MRIREVRIDCDGDALIYSVVPQGPACHTNKESCFWRRVIGSSLDTEEGELEVEILKVAETIV